MNRVKELGLPVLSGLVLLIFLMLAIVALNRQSAKIDSLEAELRKVSSQNLELNAQKDGAIADAKHLRSKLVDTSVELGEMRSRLSWTEDRLDKTKKQADIAAGTPTVRLFFDQFTDAANADNNDRFIRIKRLEDAYAAWKQRNNKSLPWVESYIAKERSEAVDSFSLLKGLLTRYYPDEGSNLRLPETP